MSNVKKYIIEGHKKRYAILDTKRQPIEICPPTIPETSYKAENLTCGELVEAIKRLYYNLRGEERLKFYAGSKDNTTMYIITLCGLLEEKINEAHNLQNRVAERDKRIERAKRDLDGFL